MKKISATVISTVCIIIAAAMLYTGCGDNSPYSIPGTPTASPTITETVTISPTSTITPTATPLPTCVALYNYTSDLYTSGWTGGWLMATSFTATAAHNVNYMMAMLDEEGQYIAGIYTNSGYDLPDTRLTQSAWQYGYAHIWNYTQVPQITLTAGVKYWIAVVAENGMNGCPACPNTGLVFRPYTYDASGMPATLAVSGWIDSGGSIRISDQLKAAALNCSY